MGEFVSKIREGVEPRVRGRRMEGAASMNPQTRKSFSKADQRLQANHFHDLMFHSNASIHDVEYLFGGTMDQNGQEHEPSEPIIFDAEATDATQLLGVSDRKMDEIIGKSRPIPESSTVVGRLGMSLVEQRMQEGIPIKFFVDEKRVITISPDALKTEPPVDIT